MERVNPIWIPVVLIVIPLAIAMFYSMLEDSLDKIWENIKGIWIIIVAIAIIILAIAVPFLLYATVGNLLFSLIGWLTNHLFSILCCCIIIVIIAVVLKNLE